MSRERFTTLSSCLTYLAIVLPLAAQDGLVFQPRQTNGKHIVLIAGDEEYRSEESMPMLAKILSQKHGFRCTVLFSFGPDGADYIDANNQRGLRGLKALDAADLMIIATRFRRPNAQQAQHITKFLNAGKPIIGLRTATHAFAGDGKFGGTLPFGEFGLRILGEEWVDHHGQHQQQGTRSVVASANASHPILRDVASFFAPSDVYGVVHLRPSDRVLLRGAVTTSLHPDSPNVSGKPNDPMQPLAWLHEYRSPDGQTTGQAFCTTSGASVDFVDANLRRLVINAAYFLSGQGVPRQADVAFVDPFFPSFYGFIRDENYWRHADVKLNDYRLGNSFGMPDPAGSPPWPHRDKQPLQLRHGQRIALVGNSLAERMNLYGHFETLLHHRFPDKQLLVRNFGWPADEVANQQRPYNYTKLDDPLEVFGPDLFVCFFGFNESFAGTEDVAIEQFIKDYREYIQDKVHRCSLSDGTSPEFILVSPVAFESSHDPVQPEGTRENERLEVYAAAIRELARADGHAFVDLYTLTSEPFSAQPQLQFTVNGAHLNEEGDRFVGQLLDRALFGEPDAPQIDLGSLRLAVNDKAWHHLQDYRMLNGWYVYGGRRTWDTETFPAEYKKIRNMVAVRDQYVWDLAAGKPAPAEPDDSRTGSVVVPDTMFGTRDESFREYREPKTLDYPTPQASIDQMTMPDGYQVKLFASEERFPELANPVQLNFDNQGRLWVACMANYPQWSPAGSKPNDRLLIFEDTNDDGIADQSTVFYDKLICPTGFEFWNGGVLVMDQPRLLFLKDSDGDDKADQVVHLLDGFASDDTHHAAGGWEFSPGGLLYMLEGISMSTTLETPWGPLRNQGPSGAYVVDPLTWKVRYFRTPGYGNPWCLVFDQWGQGIIGDGTGAQHHWATPLSGAPVDSRRTLRTIFDNEGMRPAVGSDFLTTRQFPEEVHDHFIYGCVINMHGLPRFTIHDEPGTAGMTGKRSEDFLASTDNFFRPVDPKIGPDGTLWFGDWCNPLIGHMQYSQRDPNRDHDHGRIYRMVYNGRPVLETVTQRDKSIGQLLLQLLAYEPRTRYRARRELRQRPPADVLAAIDRWVADSNDARRLCEAMWVQAGFRAVHPELLRRVLQLDDFHARAAAVHTIGNEHERIPEAAELLAAATQDKHPRVRLEAVRALSFLDSVEAAELALAAAEQPMDYWIDYTLEHSLRALSDKIDQDGEFLAEASSTVRACYEEYKRKILPGGKAVKPLQIVTDEDAAQSDRDAALKTLAGMDGGEVEVGKLIYQRVCSSCHQVHGEGKNFGPNLTSVARRLDKAQIIKSIVWPNEDISEGYETLMVETDSGKTYSGFLVEETDDQLTMRIAEGELLTLSKDEIEERQQKKASSMPTGLMKTIAPIEYLALIAYLERRDDHPHDRLHTEWIETTGGDREPRKRNGLVEISQHAAVQLEPNFPDHYNQNANLLLSNADTSEQRYPDFVFHSPDYQVDDPLIVIRLPKASEFRQVWIQNRNSDNESLPARAKSLTMWLSNDGQAWEQVWQAEKTSPEWNVDLPPGTCAKYIKLGLTESGYLHLNRVAVFAEPPRK